MKLLNLAIVFVLLIAQSAQAQPNARRNENWWTQQDATFKAAYIVGLMDGSLIGHIYSIPAEFDTDKKANKHEAIAKIVIEQYEKNTKPFANVPVSQLLDGLDELYADFRNRTIGIIEGVRLVHYQILGLPKDEVEKRLQQLRRSP